MSRCQGVTSDRGRPMSLVVGTLGHMASRLDGVIDRFILFNDEFGRGCARTPWPVRPGRLRVWRWDVSCSTGAKWSLRLPSRGDGLRCPHPVGDAEAWTYTA